MERSTTSPRDFPPTVTARDWGSQPSPMADRTGESGEVLIQLVPDGLGLGLPVAALHVSDDTFPDVLVVAFEAFGMVGETNLHLPRSEEDGLLCRFGRAIPRDSWDRTRRPWRGPPERSSAHARRVRPREESRPPGWRCWGRKPPGLDSPLSGCRDHRTPHRHRRGS